MTDSVYVLSATYYRDSGYSSLYVSRSDESMSYSLDGVVTQLHKAKLFETEEAAQHYKDFNTVSPLWKIESVSKKRIFTDTLKG